MRKTKTKAKQAVSLGFTLKYLKLAGYTAGECSKLFPSRDLYHECCEIKSANDVSVNTRVICFNPCTNRESKNGEWPPRCVPGYFNSHITSIFSTTRSNSINDIVIYQIERVHPFWDGVGVRTKLDRLLEFKFTEQDYHSMRMPIAQCRIKGCKPYQLLVAGYTENELRSEFTKISVMAAILASKGFGIDELRRKFGVSAQSIYDCGAFTLKELFEYLEPIPYCAVGDNYRNASVVCRYAYPERFIIAKSAIRTFANECKNLRFTYTPTECRELGFSALKVSGLVPTSHPGKTYSELPQLVLDAGYTMTELIYGCPVDVLVLCVGRMRLKCGAHQIRWSNRIRFSIIQYLTIPKFVDIGDHV